MQCGYCTPGMIVEGVALLKRQADPSDEEIARAMEGHVCRCCAYSSRQALRRAARETNGVTRTPKKGSR